MTLEQYTDIERLPPTHAATSSTAPCHSVVFRELRVKCLQQNDPRGPLQTRLLRSLTRLADDPRNAANVKAMKGSDLYRLRVGDWRVIYALREPGPVCNFMQFMHITKCMESGPQR